MADVKTIVVLGAGPAALPVIRQTMVNQVMKRKDLKMVVVSPNTHFLWPVAMPRVVVPGQISDDKVIIPLEPTFSTYPTDKFEWIQGKAISLDTTSSLVSVELNSSATVREVNYHTLIIATGSRTRDGLIWKDIGSTEATKAKLHEIQDQISKAKTIVVSGGGLTGSETAGELGFEYSQHGTKEVIFIYSDDLPLAPPATDGVRKQTLKELKKLKVKTMPKTTVISATPSGSDTILEVRSADGTTKKITANAYLPATGIIPNTEFVPKNLLDSNGYVKQTTHLKVEGQKNIFVIGDAGNLENSQLGMADKQAQHLFKNLPAHLDGGEIPEYTPANKPMFAVTLGRSRATGQMGTMKLFSIMICPGIRYDRRSLFKMSFLLNMIYGKLTTIPPQKEDCTGKVGIITGGNGGIALEAARHFTQLNAARVILACRSLEKGEHAKKDIEETTGKHNVVEVWHLDLASHDSVREFADRVNKLDRVDVLINNAGLLVFKRELIEGHESMLSINCRLPVQETNIIKALDEQPSVLEHYNKTKLVQLIFMTQLAKAIEVSGKGHIIVNGVHPGFCSTPLFDNTPWPFNLIFKGLLALFGRAPEVGSRALLAGAFADESLNGNFMSNGAFHELPRIMQGDEGEKMCRKVWEELSGVLEGIEPGVTNKI
ncbi:hypothetical protein FPRO04_01294 [Fusarium proliferatum]|nr:hypothetical protein FPRO03_09349 [Fusarium proliferatum]KAG4276796.1 hypothetical protein FPRO04_01294 [Fusarium proliferatum]